MCCRDRIFGSSKSHNQPRTTAGVCCRDRYPTDRLDYCCTDSCLTSHHQAIFAVHVYIFQLTTRVLPASWVVGQGGDLAADNNGAPEHPPLGARRPAGPSLAFEPRVIGSTARVRALSEPSEGVANPGALIRCRIDSHLHFCPSNLQRKVAKG